MRDYRNWSVALVVFLVLGGMGLVQYAFAQKFIDLHNNLCTVVASSKTVDAQQVTFYSLAADRAAQRAKVDTGSLRQSDLDAVRQDNNLVRQYASGLKFQFPGCT